MSEDYIESSGLVSLSLWERFRVRAYGCPKLANFFGRLLGATPSNLPVTSVRGCALSPHPQPFSQREKGGLRWKIAQLLAVLLCAGSLKWYYSTASVNQLRWILWPTTQLVEFVTGARFEFESHAGYMNSEHTFLIAASCAGVNFLITGFLLLSLTRLWRDRTGRVPWMFIPVVAVIVYVTTIIANTVRISIALQLLGAPVKAGSLTPNQLHRLEGILIYFGFLLLLFVISEEIGLRKSSDRHAMADAEKRSSRASARLIFPLAVYYSVTWVIPLVNGGYRQGGGFWEHSLFVLLTPLLLMLPLFALRRAQTILKRERAHKSSTTRDTISLRPRSGLAHPAIRP